MKALNALLSALVATATVGAASALAAKPAAAPAPDLAKGQATAQVCSACPTVDGSRGSPATPLQAGPHPEYLVKQLQEFKAGKRKNAIMAGFAATLSDDDMRNVAAFYASKTAKPGAAKDKDLAALGEKIYRGGIGDRNIPACAGCHSPTGAGIPAQYPRVGGQHADYTEAQLVAFRVGARGNSAQMSAIAAKMNDREIKAVSDYIAGLR
ncbi:MAG: c-type cytochrome [Burkholderiaceae bacterium]